jgi:DNA-binding NarL/FixJ family response regulator
MESSSTSVSESTETSERLVLLIEQNQADLKLCKKAILTQSHLYGVHTATTGEEALAKLQVGKYDVIVMDYETSETEGSELLQTVHKSVPDCPIIVITREDSPELALKILLSGASDYLPKIADYQKFLPRAITTNLQRAMLLENLRETYQRVAQASKDEALLNRMIVSIHGSLNMEEITMSAAQSLINELGTSRAVICLASDPLSPVRVVGYATADEALSSITSDSGLLTSYHDLLLDVGERRPLVVLRDDTFAFAQDVRSDLVQFSILSMLMVPLMYRGRLMGFLHVDQCDYARLWTVNEINLLTRIANQLAIAMSQARLYQIVETQSNSIDKLTELCTQLSSVVSSTRDFSERQESREKVRVHLSIREIEVLRHVANGKSNREIADTLSITEGTTEVHVSRLRKKLNLSSRAALVRYAFENHIC